MVISLILAFYLLFWNHGLHGSTSQLVCYYKLLQKTMQWDTADLTYTVLKPHN